MELKKMTKLAGIFSLIMIFMSCGPRVVTEKTTSKSLSIYDTFAYLPNTTADIPGTNYNDEDINYDIIEAVNDNLERWYNLDRTNPDLLVLINTATDVEVGTDIDPAYATYPYVAPVTEVSPFYDPYYYWDYATWPGIADYDTDVYAYKEGTLVINLVDRETQEIVWKGVANGNIYNLSNDDAIKEMVNNIFSEFPLNE